MVSFYISNILYIKILIHAANTNFLKFYLKPYRTLKFFFSLQKYALLGSKISTNYMKEFFKIQG